jgi:hypothetical protein
MPALLRENKCILLDALFCSYFIQFLAHKSTSLVTETELHYQTNINLVSYFSRLLLIPANLMARTCSHLSPRVDVRVSNNPFVTTLTETYIHIHLSPLRLAG